MLSLIDNTRTDKNTTHSYIPLYESLLEKRREKVKNVLEIGIDKGGSIKLWHDYFPMANVYGLDIMKNNDVWDELKNNGRIHLMTETNAYTPEVIDSLRHIQFDMILDDGPHTLESMKFYVQNYSSLLADDGILILEDVQSMDWLLVLSQCVPEDLQKYVKTYDLRENKGRYDDIVFVIDKSV
jgi:hypothetical protein